MVRAFAFGAGFFLCALAVGETLNAYWVWQNDDGTDEVEADGFITLWPPLENNQG